MELALSNQQAPFEVTFDKTNLPVAMSVWDVSTGAPSLVYGPTAMDNVTGTNTYFGMFTPQNNKQYLVLKAVYTDNSFATLDSTYAQGSESIYATDLSGGGGGGGSSAPDIEGFLDDETDEIEGFLTD